MFPIYNEIKSNTQSRMNIVIGGAIGGATLMYEVIAVLGYLTFGSKVGFSFILEVRIETNDRRLGLTLLPCTQRRQSLLQLDSWRLPY